MRRKLTLLSFAFMLSAFVVGCVQDDPKPQPEPEINYAEKLVGTFKGDATYGSEAVAVTAKSTIKATAMNIAEITVIDYQFNATTKSDLVISGVKVELADEKNLSLSGNAQATVGGQSVDVALTGSALVGGENVKFDISVAGFNGVKYSGSRYTNAVGAELMSPMVSGICVLSSTYDAAKGIITYTVPTHAREIDLAAIKATFTISDGASWVMKDDTKASEAHKIDLKKAETTIEVTAENGEKKSYTFKREAVNAEDVSLEFMESFVGNLDVVLVSGTPPTPVEGQKVFASHTAANMMKFTVNNFKFGEINLGNIVVDNVALYKGTSEVVLSGDGKVNIDLGAGTTEVVVKVGGKYVLADNKLTLNLEIAVDKDLTVTATYTGTPFSDYNFSDWTTTTLEPDDDGNVVSPYSGPNGWQDPNMAVALIKTLTTGDLYPYDGVYPVSPIDAGKVGKAAKIVTLDTKGGPMMGGWIQAPKITSGTIFTGVFNPMAAAEDPMLATQFGLPYGGAKLTQLKGWYTYAPGAKYFDYADGIWTETSTVDEPSISVVLYEVSTDKDFLTGKDIYTSPSIVGMGKINPMNATTFTKFTVDLTYTKEYTPETKKYKLAMIMSASRDGDKFKGAPGSTLVVDELTLVTE